MMANKWVEFTVQDVATMAILIQRHVKPDMYIEDGTVRPVIQACQDFVATKSGLRVVPS